MLIEFAAVGFGGFIGAYVRFLLTKLLPGTAFPFATLCANVFAGAAIGVVIGLDLAAPLPPRVKLFNVR
jgi:fluoride ion exporter CrcB/FEX